MSRESKKFTAFGKYISKSLIDRNMSKTQLAASVGTTPQYLNKMLHGVRPGAKYLSAITKVLQLDPVKVEKLTAA
ncbi:MAG: helix-turn-helix transcriptional regulator [Christensenella sp.]